MTDPRCTQTYPRYPVEPFLDWLIPFMEKYELSNRDVAKLAGVSEKCVYRWRNENRLVALDQADRLVTALGMPWLLDEWWPVECDDALAA